MTQFIEIPNWDRFQHYRSRDPVWIKCYTRLLDDDAYLSLTPPQRALLHSLWMLYAKSGRKVPVNTSKLSRKLGMRVTKRSLEALSHAGFITFRASEVLDQRREEKIIKSFREITNPRQALEVLNGGVEDVA